jgi:hypothetical protein
MDEKSFPLHFLLVKKMEREPLEFHHIKPLAEFFHW